MRIMTVIEFVSCYLRGTHLEKNFSSRKYWKQNLFSSFDRISTLTDIEEECFVLCPIVLLPLSLFKLR